MHDENALQMQLTNAEFEALADYISSWPMPLAPTDAAEMLLHDALIEAAWLALEPEDDALDK